ncbi:MULTISPECIES: serine hydrolase [Dyella]|uniref:Serine hydrolase n=2 Tax=Dyella TaxID=231454 RepID=A0A4R0YHK8_9GAMM|nr:MULTISPECIES: serine hydrolase [Dyella]TBR37011.1 serine hydrolase [Dyella terrae]TCI07900.1 serine hydrolase [Dyella soli]
MNRFSKRWVALFAALAASTAIAQTPTVPTPIPAPATSTNAPAPVSNVATTPELTREDLTTFFDGMVPFAIRRSDIAGGVISVVKDGQIIYAKGFGYSDLEKRTPVSPDDTLFRTGSTSKLFTWTAVMQQVEQGKLDLDKDVNEYLDFKIPPYNGKPVTLRHLMTHTGGFEEVARGLLPATADEVGLEKYLKTHIPARIFAPGEVVAYSNYGCGLAGYIVQRVSGEEFNAYIKHHIYDPLDMKHSSFDQPLPADLAPLMSKAYKSASDGKPQPFEFVNPAPAGSQASSAVDMAHFMIAHLQNGQYDGKRILNDKTAIEMHSPQYTAAPGLPGFALGFYQEDRNGLRIIGHGGDTVVFHTDLHLLLDKNVGVFMSFNSAGSHEGGGVLMVRTAIFHAFLDRYFPQAAPEQPTLSTAKADAARVVGTYEVSRRNESALRMLYLLTQIKVSADENGEISVPMFVDYAGKPLHWREVGPLQYREVNGKNSLNFVVNEDGSIRHFATDFIPGVELFQRVSNARSMGTVLQWGGLSLLVVFAALIVWFAGWWMRRHYRSTLDLPQELRRSRLLSRLGAVSLAVGVVGWFALIAATSANENLMLHGTAAPWMLLLYVLCVIALLGVIAIVVHTVRTLHPARRSKWVRIGEILLAIAALYLAWVIVVFGMISFNVRF